MNQHGDHNPYAPPAADDFGHEAFDHGILATRGSRFVAKLIDGLLDMLVLIPGMVWFVTSLSEPSDNHRFFTDQLEPNYSELMVPVSIILLPLAALTIFQWYLIAKRGQTLGKRWMKIRIIRQDGSAAGFVNGVILRNWVMSLLSQVPYVGGLIGLVDACFIFSDNQQCLHDKIAGTKVVAVMPGEG